jgi:flagellar assembly factor FliW
METDHSWLNGSPQAGTVAVALDVAKKDRDKKKETAAVEIETTRFGKLRIKESELIGMRGHILGFERHKRFVLLTIEDNPPFLWLQSADDPASAFVVINPLIVNPNYTPAISEGDLALLDIQKTEEIALLAIVTVRSSPVRATANLRAPILINAEKRSATQTILDDSDYPIQYDILGNNIDFKSRLSAKGLLGGSRLDRVPPSAAG